MSKAFDMTDAIYDQIVHKLTEILLGLSDCASVIEQGIGDTPEGKYLVYEIEKAKEVLMYSNRDALRAIANSNSVSDTLARLSELYTLVTVNCNMAVCVNDVYNMLLQLRNINTFKSNVIREILLQGVSFVAKRDIGKFPKGTHIALHLNDGKVQARAIDEKGSRWVSGVDALTAIRGDAERAFNDNVPFMVQGYV